MVFPGVLLPVENKSAGYAFSLLVLFQLSGVLYVYVCVCASVS